MNEFKSSRHTYQVRPLSTEAWDSLRSLGVLNVSEVKAPGTTLSLVVVFLYCLR